MGAKDVNQGEVERRPIASSAGALAGAGVSMAPPGSATPLQVLHRSIGNAGVSRLVETAARQANAESPERATGYLPSEPGPTENAPLDPAVRALVEPVAGASLAGVRLHSGPSVDSLAHEGAAAAFTQGSDVFLSTSSLQSPAETRLATLAHELTHVAGQRSTGPRLQLQTTEEAEAATVAAPGAAEQGEGGAAQAQEAAPGIEVAVKLRFSPEPRGRQRFTIAETVVEAIRLNRGADELRAQEQAALRTLAEAVSRQAQEDRPDAFEDFMPGPELAASFRLNWPELDAYIRYEQLPDVAAGQIADAVRTASRAPRQRREAEVAAVSKEELRRLINRGLLGTAQAQELAAEAEAERGVTERISATLALNIPPSNVNLRDSARWFNDALERLGKDDLTLAAMYTSFGTHRLQAGEKEWRDYYESLGVGAERAVNILAGIAITCGAILAALGGGAAGMAVAGEVGAAGGSTVAVIGAGAATAALTGAAIGGLYRPTLALLRMWLGDPSINAGTVASEAQKGALNGMIDGLTGFLGMRIAVYTLPALKSVAARYAVSMAADMSMGGLAAMFQVVIEKWPNTEDINPREIVIAGLIGAGIGSVTGVFGARSAGKQIAEDRMLREAAEAASRRHAAAQATIIESAGDAAVRLVGGDAAQLEFIENFLRYNNQDRPAMIAFYRKLGWDRVKALGDTISPSLFNRIQRVRDDIVREAWSEVHQDIQRRYGVDLATPFVGSPPGSAGYKGAYSDIDLSVTVQEGSGVAAPRRIQIEIEAMQLMDAKLRRITPAPDVDWDVNVYTSPKPFPVAEGGEAAQRVARFSGLMDYYEVRLGYGHDAPRWNRWKQDTLATARAQNNEAAVREGFAFTEGRYTNYRAQVDAALQQRQAAGGAVGEAQMAAQARNDVRRAMEDRMQTFLRDKESLLTGSGPASEAARAEYNMLQLEMRATWPEAYIGAPAAQLGAAPRDVAGALAGAMPESELMRAQLSQARFILDWLGHDSRAVIQLWKTGKYQMRDLELFERVYDFTRPANEAWMEYLKQMKKARTPEEAWGMWVERHYGDELIAEQKMREQLEMLRWETEQWLSSYFASRTPVAVAGQAGGGGRGGGGGGGGRPPAAAGGSGGSGTPSGSGTPTRRSTTQQDSATLRSAVETETQTRRTTPASEATPKAPSTTETAGTAGGSTRRGTPESSTRESAADGNQTPALLRTPARMLNEAEYDVVPVTEGINSGKVRLTHKTTRRSYLFKPASGETHMEYGPDISIQAGDRYRRGPAAAAVGQQLGIAAPGTELVVFRGEVGSLQEWITGPPTLYSLGRNDRALYDRVRQSQQFRDLDTFDYLIANMDRHSGNVLVDVRPDGSFRLIPIDTDAVFPPSAVRFSVALTDIASVKEWERMYGNPMSRELYNHLRHMAQNRHQLRRALSLFLEDAEIDGMLTRLDQILDGVYAGRIQVQ